jgi:hypothetical protein
MTLSELTSQLDDLDIRLFACGDELEIDPPDDEALTDEIMAALREHKAALLCLQSELSPAVTPPSNLDLVLNHTATRRSVREVEIEGGRVVEPGRADRRESQKAATREHKPAVLAGLFPAEPDPSAPAPGPGDRSSCPYPWVTPERLAVAARGDELRRLGLAVPLCWLPDDDRQERAAIMEYDGHLPREAAERAAGLTAPGELTP